MEEYSVGLILMYVTCLTGMNIQLLSAVPMKVFNHGRKNKVAIYAKLEFKTSSPIISRTRFDISVSLLFDSGRVVPEQYKVIDIQSITIDKDGNILCTVRVQTLSSKFKRSKFRLLVTVIDCHGEFQLVDVSTNPFLVYARDTSMVQHKRKLIQKLVE